MTLHTNQPYKDYMCIRAAEEASFLGTQMIQQRGNREIAAVVIRCLMN